MVHSPKIGPVHDDVSLDDELGAAAGGAGPQRHVVALLQADDGSHLFDDSREHIERSGDRCCRCGRCVQRVLTDAFRGWLKSTDAACYAHEKDDHG